MALFDTLNRTQARGFHHAIHKAPDYHHRLTDYDIANFLILSPLAIGPLAWGWITTTRQATNARALCVNLIDRIAGGKQHKAAIADNGVSV